MDHFNKAGVLGREGDGYDRSRTGAAGYGVAPVGAVIGYKYLVAPGIVVIAAGGIHHQLLEGFGLLHVHDEGLTWDHGGAGAPACCHTAIEQIGCRITA